MQKAVLRVEWCNEKERKRAVKMVSAYEGIQSMAVDRDTKKVTLIGDMDPVEVAETLRKRFDTFIEYLGPNETPARRREPATEQNNTDTNVNGANNRYWEGVAYHPYYPPQLSPSYNYPPSAPPLCYPYWS